MDSLSNKQKDKIRAIIADKLGVDVEDVVDLATVEGDLGADFLDMVELIMEFEAYFDCIIPDEEADKITTVGDIFTCLEACNVTNNY